MSSIPTARRASGTCVQRTASCVQSRRRRAHGNTQDVTTLTCTLPTPQGRPTSKGRPSLTVGTGSVPTPHVATEPATPPVWSPPSSIHPNTVTALQSPSAAVLSSAATQSTKLTD
ncbi:hypothetical protein BaRGS_00010434 [Batillaria attramentaria]|uniref:Uncharacterized protein n=1 Tax=Batillaria attramentaria TaxID=370345 RepID=A0ABD0LGU5_9CAEN